MRIERMEKVFYADKVESDIQIDRMSTIDHEDENFCTMLSSKEEFELERKL